MSDGRRDECDAFAATVNAVLDGDAPASALATGHPAGCPDCRALAAAARLLASAGPGLRILPCPSPALRPRLVRTVTQARRRRRWVQAITAGLAVAAGTWLAWPNPDNRQVVGRAVPDAGSPTSGTARPTATSRVADQWAAVASVARSASEKAVAPVRLLPTTTVSLASRPAPVTAPDLTAFAPLEKATKATAEPATGATRRAVGLFLRDLGLSAPAKPAG